MSKVLKILTIVSFLSITLKGVHVGGPLGFFLVLGLFQSDDLLMLIASIVCLSVLAIFVYSIFKPLGRRDFLLFVVGGIILLLPTGWLVIYLTPAVSNVIIAVCYFLDCRTGLDS